MKLLLELAVILACLVGMLWMVASLLGQTFFLLDGLWKARAGMNPMNAAGRWRLLGLGLIVFGVLQMGGLLNLDLSNQMLIWIGWKSSDVPLGESVKIPLFLLGLGFGYVGFRCLGRAKRYETQTVDQALADDPRPPVLYLRSFEDDARVARRLGVAGLTLSTEETELARIVHPFGPLVAIGRPGEPIPWAGAARKYVSDAEWKNCVRELMAEARLVILRAGVTAGLVWELAESAKCVRPERLIVLLPLKQPQYEVFRSNAQQVLPCQLPEYDGRRNPVTTLRAVLFFDSDWTPHILPVQETTSEYMMLAISGEISLNADQSKLQRVLLKTLQPVLERIEVQSDKRTAPRKSPRNSPPRPAQRDARGRFLPRH